MERRGGDATPEIEEARGRTRSRAWWSETEAAAGRAAALTASVSLLRYTSGYPLRDTRGEGGMQRENTRHTRKRRRLSKERGETALSLYPNFPRKEVSGNRCRGSRPTSIELASSLHRSKPIPQISFPSISVKSCICVYIYI